MALGHQILLRIMPFAENANQYIYYLYCRFFALSSQEVAIKSLKVYTLITCFTDSTTYFLYSYTMYIELALEDLDFVSFECSSSWETLALHTGLVKQRLMKLKEDKELISTKKHI